MDKLESNRCLAIAGMACVLAITLTTGLCGCQSTSMTDTTKTRVVVTTRSIVAGEALTAENCRVDEWPVTYIPENHVSRLDQLDHSVATGPISANQVIASAQVGKLIAPIISSSNNHHLDRDIE